METPNDLWICPYCAAACLSSDRCGVCGWRIDSLLAGVDPAFIDGKQPCASFDWAVDAATGVRLPGQICACGAEEAPCDSCGRYHHGGGWENHADRWAGGERMPEPDIVQRKA